MATRKNTKNATPQTEDQANEAAAKAAIEAYRAAQAKVDSVEAELRKVKATMKSAVEKLHEVYGSQWIEIDGKLVQARKNKAGFNLVPWERERPTPAAVIA